jgi:hypothetical protein
MKKHLIRIIYLTIGLVLGFVIGRTEIISVYAGSNLQGDGGACNSLEEITDINDALSCLIQMGQENSEKLDQLLLTTQDTNRIVNEAGTEQTVEDRQTEVEQAQEGQSASEDQPVEEPTPEDTQSDLIELTHSGSTVVNVEKGYYPTIAIITGNDEGEFFSVSSYYADSDVPHLLVNTVKPYNGVRPLDLYDELTTRLEVKAVGEWSINLLPASEADLLTVPGTYEGSGDTVLSLEETPDTATIVGNSAGTYFSLTGHGGRFPDLMVNSIKPYEGTVLVDPETILFEIQAEGPWTITVE